jgi:peptidoglycan/LPS O-acetylase OafA/YrhL
LKGGRKASAALTGDLAGLTALRFMAALWVVLYHYRDQLSFNLDHYTALFSKGYLAVDFFFVLSGFIMAHVYGAAVEAGRFSHRAYLWKRFARLYPLHLATLLAVIGLWAAFRLAGLSPASDEKYDFMLLPAHVLAVHAWGVTPHNAWNIPSWSISAEFGAYLLFPLLMGLSLKFRPRLGLAVALVVFGAAWGAALAFTGAELTEFQTMGIVRILPEFLLGIALRRAWVAAPAWLPWLLAAAALTLAEFSPTDLPTVLALAALVPAAASLGAPRPLHYLGEASYSLYMVHAIVQTVYFNAVSLAGLKPQDAGASIAVALGGVGLAIVASMISYELIEKPARTFLTHRRLKAEPAL